MREAVRVMVVRVPTVNPADPAKVKALLGKDIVPVVTKPPVLLNVIVAVLLKLTPPVPLSAPAPVMVMGLELSNTSAPVQTRADDSV